jgi:hypothetical protein
LPEINYVEVHRIRDECDFCSNSKPTND